MMAHPPARTGRATVLAALFAGAAALIGGSMWYVLEGRPGLGGAAALGAGSLAIGGSLLSRTRGAKARLFDSAVDRAFDGCIFGAIVWEMRATNPAVAAGALLALAAGFLGAYIRVRGVSLKYEVEESLAGRALRYAIVSLGLLAGWLAGSMYAAAGVSSLSAIVRASQVVKEERG